MSMIATVALLAITPLKEVADLCLVDAIRDTKVTLTMCVKTILVIAPT
jgi:hypothetical protein